MKVTFHPHKISWAIIFWVIAGALPASAQNSYYFPQQQNFDPVIPTPEHFMGYGIGERHSRYEQSVAYLKELERLSDKVTVQTIGHTYEMRPQVVVIITSPDNQNRMESIRQQHLQLADLTKPMPNLANMPVFVNLGYSVHGNEASSLEAALLTAYFFTANLEPETQRSLKEAVLLIDPAHNPDGRDRHANWINVHQSDPAVSDPADWEHNEVWPSGRGNHYWFDLNRDWLPLAHVESRNRLKFYHQWLPNVVIDFHEMGTNSSYYFEPSKPYGSENPLVPRSTYDNLNNIIAKYHAAALDEIGSLYFTKEQFDNIYPGYGSTYPDFQGGVGITTEQASSRGNRQENSTGILTFAFGIRNHVSTGLATVKGAVENREIFLKHQRDFFQLGVADGRESRVKAYVYGEKFDATRLRHFTELLLAHHIDVYEANANQTVNGLTFEKGKAFVVPTDQPQYRLVESIFGKTTQLPDSVFYDASTWTLALAYGIPHAGVPKKVNRGNKVTQLPEVTFQVPPQSHYAYLLDWSDYNTAGALYQLQEHGLVTQAALKPFTAHTSAGPKEYLPGAITVPVASQRLTSDSVYKIIQKVAADRKVTFTSVTTGFSAKGIDLGSPNIQTLKKPEALMLVGNGIMGPEAGETWFLLDSQLRMPITKAELSAFPRLSLSRYNTIVLVSGTYNNLDKNTVDKLKRWVQEGGTLITFKSAAEWAIRQGLADSRLLIPADTSSHATRKDYGSATEIEGAKSVGGSIYEVDLDITHPLGFGYASRKLSVYRNSTILLAPSKNPYETVAQYTASPLQSGYVSKANLKRIANSASLVAQPQGQGQVILFADNPNFRGTWYGTNRLFFNALFFGSLIRASGAPSAAAETEH